MGGGGKIPYPKHVWSPSGGWYSQPSNWKGNTIVAGAVMAAIVAVTWKFSADRETFARKPEPGEREREREMLTTFTLQLDKAIERVRRRGKIYGGQELESMVIGLLSPVVYPVIAENHRQPSPTVAFRAIRLAGLAVGVGLSALSAYHRGREHRRPMADFGFLDATGGREVVYCHACRHEWYRDQHGIVCPHCDGDITEIIDPENDPRELNGRGHNHSSSASSDRMPTRGYYDDDSDPGEADIEEQLSDAADQGFAFNRDTRHAHDHRHHDPDVDPVIHRFIDMVNGFGTAHDPRAQPGLHTHHIHRPDNRQHQDHEHGHWFDDDHHHDHGGNHPDHGPDHGHNTGMPSPMPDFNSTARDHFAGPRIHRTTIRNGPFGGTASITIFSGSMRPRDGPPAMEGGGSDPFQEIFSSIFRDIGPPPAGDGQTPAGGPGRPQGFARSLQDLLGLLNPANAVAGDAVYSQEALDRIISNLMEVNPQSNAAPPATEDALQKMVRKPVDAEMLGADDKTECSICIDEMKLGDIAMFLPCKHWFHEKCVVLWLKEHNTCPICRTPIEINERSGSANNNGGNPNGQQQPGGSSSNSNSSSGSSSSSNTNNNNNNTGNAAPSSSSMPPGFLSSYPFGSDSRSGRSSPGPSLWFTTRRFDTTGSGGGSGSDGGGGSAIGSYYYRQNARPPSQRHSRLNEALRSVSSMQEREREREREREQGSSSSVSYDTSRLQRRNSMSPTSRRTTSDLSSRMRERSPSQSSGRWAESDRCDAGMPSSSGLGGATSSLSRRQSPGGGGTGPLSWLRGRLGGSGSGSGSGDSGYSPRDEDDRRS
ncbi:E3 ubiquitin-protein ligase RNF115/126 [Geosmithia morbida]|uniref:RING-type E3 ubiquitin transferase n=1 Tax=Geosmithia morbida TaxID=1094350 RepID=A0A9P5D2N3_9HYPO|nr:E3 ubiquitin-protein ligase RNF115/126 [Geosmithia morbida]KAF4125268.1 E3 ubiquitin-protein ligase RNF115/126 [Geosmithia morbida]